MENNYISKQIAVYKTNKKLIEFMDKMQTAPIGNFAHIHAGGEKTDTGRTKYSLIGLTVQDYSAGTGDKTVRVQANLSPDDIQYIFNQLSNSVQEFNFTQEKIFGTPDEKGRFTVTKVRIARASVGSDGKVRNYPWYIEVDNGTGIAAKASTGGTYIQKSSFQSNQKAFSNINDEDFFKLLRKVSTYITIWELTHGPALIREGLNTIALNQQQS